MSRANLSLALALLLVAIGAHAATDQEGVAHANPPSESVPAGNDDAGPVDRDTAQIREWQDYMARHPAPLEGCFRATYPSTSWEEVECGKAPVWHPTHVGPR
jgi:hypothetical protein